MVEETTNSTGDPTPEHTETQWKSDKVDKLASALDRIETVTAKGKGINYLKNSPRVIALLKFTKEDGFVFKDFVPYLDISIETPSIP